MSSISRSGLLLALLLCIQFTFCVIPSGPPESPFSMSLAGDDGTVSPYGIIRLSFSYPITDTNTITFSFSPPFFNFYTQHVPSKDTILLIPSEPLKGNTRYVLRPDQEIHSVREEVISAKDSVVLVTYPTEIEPNNSISTCDLLSSKLFGSVSTVHDTDIFKLDTPQARSIYLYATGSQTTFSIEDSIGQTLTPALYSSNSSLSIPDSFCFPLYIMVYAYRRSVGGYYELGFEE